MDEADVDLLASSKIDFVSRLPPEVVLNILYGLDAEDAARALLVSRT